MDRGDPDKKKRLAGLALLLNPNLTLVQIKELFAIIGTQGLHSNDVAKVKKMLDFDTADEVSPKKNRAAKNPAAGRAAGAPPPTQPPAVTPIQPVTAPAPERGLPWGTRVSVVLGRYLGTNGRIKHGGFNSRQTGKPGYAILPDGATDPNKDKLFVDYDEIVVVLG